MVNGGNVPRSVAFVRVIAWLQVAACVAWVVAIAIDLLTSDWGDGWLYLGLILFIPWALASLILAGLLGFTLARLTSGSEPIRVRLFLLECFVAGLAAFVAVESNRAVLTAALWLLGVLPAVSAALSLRTRAVREWATPEPARRPRPDR